LIMPKKTTCYAPRGVLLLLRSQRLRLLALQVSGPAFAFDDLV
jgi:hypothetical protein